jgi:hypothetical protein
VPAFLRITLNKKFAVKELIVINHSRWMQAGLRPCAQYANLDMVRTAVLEFVVVNTKVLPVSDYYHSRARRTGKNEVDSRDGG